MILVAHRINTLEKLALVNPEHGVEIDIRGYGEQLLLNHDPISDPSQHVDLDTYLAQFAAQGNAFVIFNTKEAGYEQRIIDLAAKHGLRKDQYFLLDVEYPYLYRATRRDGVREIAVRYSEGEPIEAVEAQMKDGVPLLDWVWIDTNTRLPLDTDTVDRLRPFKTALVCPDRWGRPEDIDSYAEKVKELGMNLTMVMTSLETIAQWEKHFPK